MKTFFKSRMQGQSMIEFMIVGFLVLAIVVAFVVLLGPEVSARLAEIRNSEGYIKLLGLVEIPK